MTCDNQPYECHRERTLACGREKGATWLGHQETIKEGLELDLEGQVGKTGAGKHGVPDHGSEQQLEGQE